MAESTQHLSDNFKKKYSKIHWSKLSGFRNIIVHDYLGDIDINVVWGVIENRLPELKIILKKALEEITNNDRNK